MQHKARPPRKRLGKIRGAVIDHLDAAGGTLALDELYDALHPDRPSEKRRPRDLRRRQLPMLEDAGIVTVEGDEVSLCPDWTEALRNARELGGELEAEEVQRRCHKEQSRAFRNRHVRVDMAPTEQEIREQRESAPHRRREAIEQALLVLLQEHPELRRRRVGQLTCAVIAHGLPADFPHGVGQGCPEGSRGSGHPGGPRLRGGGMIPHAPVRVPPHDVVAPPWKLAIILLGPLILPRRPLPFRPGQSL